MPDPLTAERREELRKHIQFFCMKIGNSYEGNPQEILALLDAADERDRLAAEVAALRERVKELETKLKPAGYHDVEEFYRD